MEEAIYYQEEVIIDYFNNVIYEILVETLQKHGFEGSKYLNELEESEHLNEIEDIMLIKTIFSEYNILGLFSEKTIDSFKEFKTEVNKLKEISQDKELVKSLENISEIIQKIVDDYHFELYLKIESVKCTLLKNRNEPKITISSRISVEDDDTEETVKFREFGLKERLEYYTTTFIESIENEFLKTKEYLDGGEIQADSNSTISKVVEFCSQIDSLKTLGILTKEISVYFSKRYIKKIAKLPASIIRSCAGKENRPILTKGAYKIFTHYECQFNHISWKRPISKLGSDSADRFIYHLIENPTINEIKSEDIVRGIVEGTSPLNPNKLFFKRGRTIISTFGDEITSDTFFTGTGKCEIVNDQTVHYITEDTIYDDEKECCVLGYRLKLPWEDLSKYKITDPRERYDYKYTKEKEREQIATIYEKINPGCQYVDPENN